MSTTVDPSSPGTADRAGTATWAQWNRTYVELHLERLRLILHGKALRLRRSWRDRPAGDPGRVVVTDAEVDVLLGNDRREHRLAEHEHEHEDEVAREATARSAQVEAAIEDLATATGRRPPALEVLVERFGLTSFERDVLVLCLAPEVDPSFARLYAYVQDAPHLLYATAALAEDLFGDPGYAWQPSSPLLGYRFVKRQVPGNPHSPRSLFPLHLDSRIEDFVLGRNRPDERVRRQLRPLPTLPLPEGLRGVVAEALSQIEQQPDGAVLVDLVGPAEVGRVVAAELLRSIGLQPHEWDVRSLSQDATDVERTLRLVEREAALGGLGLYVDASKTSSLEQVLEQIRVLTVVSSAQGTLPTRVPCHVPVPGLAARDRSWFWTHFLGPGSGVSAQEVDALAQHFELGPEAIGRVVARARATASDGRGPDTSQLWQACRERGGRTLDGLGARLRAERSWDELVLPADAEAQLREIASQVAQRTRVYDEWGFGDRLSRGRGITALFAGPSGTGKTLAAEVLATDLRLDLCRVDLAGVVSKYIGETEKNLQRVFDAAEEAGWILFFDEADALFGKRTEVKDSHDRYANIEVNYLLQRMEQYRGLAILATNRRSALDRAFLRRIRFLVDFPLPDVDDRRRIWMRGFPSRTPLGELDFDGLAQLDMTGANITTVTTNAAFLAAAEDSCVEMRHVSAAIRREYAKLEQLLPVDDPALGGRS